MIGVLTEFKARPYRSKRISNYCQRMSQASTGVVVDGIVARVLRDQGFSWEEDTSSNYDPQALYDALERYSPSQSVSINLKEGNWKRAFNATFKLFAKPKHVEKLHALRSPTEVHAAIKPNKSSGLPMMTTKEDDFWYAWDRADQVRTGRKNPSPCIAYKRTQLGGKTRLVWGYPYEMTIIESRFARPLIQTYLTRNTTMAFGNSSFELGAEIARIDNSFGQTYGLDFSKFDSSVSASLIYAAFDILATWFTPQERNEFGWNIMVDYFIKTPIVMPNGKLYTGKRHGVPSGSYFTQMVDSIANTIVQFYLASKFNYSLSWEDFKVLGDDVIVSIPREVNLSDLANEVSSFGMHLHSESSKSKRYAHFLGATWVKGIPFRPHGEILKKMVYPENYRVYPSKTWKGRYHLAIQLIMQYCSAYANAVDFLPRTNSIDRWDESPVFYNQAYRDQDLKVIPDRWMPDIEKFRRTSNVTHTLSSRLMS